ncbi:MAG: RNA polymerase sigma factor [Alphaproteobacteria bacterium]
MYREDDKFAHAEVQGDVKPVVTIAAAKKEATTRKRVGGFPMPATVILMTKHLAKNGDPFWVAVQNEIPALWSYASGLTRNPVRCEDLMQGTLCKVVQSKDKFIEGSPMLPWLRKLMSNHNIDEYRRPMNRLEDEDADGQHAGTLFTPATTIESYMDAADAEKVLKRLPHEQQQILALTVLHDITYREAAELLGCPEPTLKARARRGRAAALHQLGWNEHLEAIDLDPPALRFSNRARNAAL